MAAPPFPWRGALAALALLLIPPASRATPASDAVAYTVTPVADGTGPRLRILMSFRAGQTRRTWIRLPRRFGAERELWRDLTGFRASGARLSPAEPGELVLSHEPGEVVQLAYEVRPTAGGRTGVDYRPHVGPDGFSAYGETILAYPEGRPRARASLRFGPLPAGWTAVSDAEAAPGERSLAEVLDSAMVGGSGLRLLRRPLGSSELRIALRGSFDFTDEAFADALARIIRQERGFFGDEAGDYLVTLQSQPSPGGYSMQSGVGRAHGAALFATANTPLEDLYYVMAHEPAHAWFASRLGGLPRGEAEVSAYWLSEGFADFFALRTLARTGLVGAHGYARLLQARTRFARQMPNAELTARYWSEPGLTQVPYSRGLVLALWWDARLRGSTGGRLGLEDVLKAQRARAERAAGPTADRLFPIVYRDISGLDISAEIARFIDRGELPELPDDLHPGCLTKLAPAGGVPTGLAALRIGADRFAIPADPAAAEAACGAAFGGR